MTNFWVTRWKLKISNNSIFLNRCVLTDWKLIVKFILADDHSWFEEKKSNQTKLNHMIWLKIIIEGNCQKKVSLNKLTKLKKNLLIIHKIIL